MAHDWLLVETLGSEPAVVAHGRHPEHLEPIAAFVRRKDLAAVQTAIAESVQTGQPLTSITPKRRRVIRTEPVVMSDGCVHGVHVWTGPADEEPPERPTPGPSKWDLTLGVATASRESLANRGEETGDESTVERAFADDLPSREISPDETRMLAMAINAKPGQTVSGTLDLTDPAGKPIRIGFVARTGTETGTDGRDHLVARSMSWRSDLEEPEVPHDVLAKRFLIGPARPGVHRALVDLTNQTLLKWLDEPCDFYDWRGGENGQVRIHSDDDHHMRAMATQFADGPASGVLRLPGHDTDWVPVHVAVERVELEPGTFAGLVSLRLPTAKELKAAGLRG
jgi:hypothetical protein